ncbi:MAG: response regulator [Myxococcaceae bacterium]
MSGRDTEERRLRVLVVEDDPDTREYLGELVGLWGHLAECEGSCAKALEAARRRAPDVALVDLGLPEVSGHEVARGIRALEAKRPGTPRSFLVALSGYGAASDQQQAMAAGFDEHLVKPVDAPAIQKLLARAAAARGRRAPVPP